MALTRPRYSQIPDSDYKNSCRIVTTTNVTLTSGAPQTYDGVTLVQYDRVLVTGQTDKTQNGIYSVSTLGSGSNGTWVRSKDANANDRLTAGMNTFIEEGTYTGQFWHLLTPGPIVLGVTELIFGQLSGNTTITSGFVIGNLVIGGNIVSNSGNVSNSTTTGALVITGSGGAGIGGNVNVGGNVTADKFYTTNGLFWAANGLAFSSGLEVSEINAANALSNISTSVTAIRFDKDTGFSVNELNPGNIKISLGSSFKTWHVPGQADLVAAAEDEVTFFGNGIDITTNPAFPKSITFISNNMLLEANIGAFYNYANANIGSIYNNLNTLDANVGAFESYANIYLSTAATFTVTNAGAGAYIINSESNPTLYLIRGQKYNFSVSASGHPFWIKTAASIGTGDQYNTGVVNNGDDVGLITFDVPLTAPDVLYYICQYHSGMNGQLRIVNFAEINANIGTLFLGNASTNANIGSIYNQLNTLDANIGAFEIYANANIGTLFLGNASTQANLGAFQTYSNAAITNIITNANANIAAYLTTTTSSNIAAANINTGNVFSNSITTTGNVNVGGNIISSNVYTGNIVSSGNITTSGNVNIDGNLFIQGENILSNIATFQSFANLEFASIGSAVDNLYTNTTDFYSYANLSFGNITSNLGAFETYANSKIGNNSNSNLVVRSTTESVSAITGALVVAGGAGIGGNLYVAGNIYAANLTAISISTLSVTDPMLYLTASNPFPYNYDIGFFSHYSLVPGTEENTGLARNYTTGIWGFFSNTTNEPGATVDWTDANLIYDAVRVGELIASNTTPSTSTTTGALRVAGGAGIVGNLYITNTGDVSANIGRLHLGNIALNANLGAYQSYANNAISNVSLDLSLYKLYANANIGELYLGNLSTNANLGAFQSYSNANIGSIYNNLTTLDANIGSYQLYSNANIGSIYNNLTTLDANIGSYQTFANANAATQSTSLDTINANIGAFYTYANTIIGPTNTGNLVVNATTDSVSQVTGALVVKGGAGIAGNVYTSRVYTNTGIFWLGNGAAYAASSGGGGGGSSFTYTASATTPVVANIGDQWFDTVDGVLYEYIDDGDSNQWVDMQSATLSANNVITSLSGNVSTSGNISSGGSVISANIFTGNISSNANITSGNITSGNIVSTGNITTSGVIYATTVTGSNVIITANLSGGNVTTGNVTTTGNITSTQSVAANSIITSGGVYWANGTAFASTTYSNANVVSYFVTGANIGSGSTTSNLVALATTTATSSTTGALVVAGGMGVAGNVFAAGNVVLGTGTTSNVVAAATTTSTSTTTGALIVRGGAGIAGNIFATANVILGSGTTSNVVAAATTTSTSTTTGALVVRGGAGIAGNVYTDRVYTTNGLFWSGNGVAFSSGGSPFATNVVVTSGTNSTSTTSGALVLTGSGGLGIGGSANIGGAVKINSTATATSTTTGALIVSGGVGIAGDIILNGFVQSLSGVTSTSTTTGTFSVGSGGGIGVTGNVYVGTELVVPGGGKLTSTGLAYLLEKASISANPPASSVDIDVTTQSVLYWTANAANNSTANIRGSSTTPLNSVLAVGQSVTVVMFFPNGASNYYVNTVKIDNTTVTAAYQGNAAPTIGNSNSIDIYSFTILKTASATYKVFASQTQFMHPG